MPVRDYLSDASGDLAIINNDFALVGGDTDQENNEAVAQSCTIGLRMFKGDSFINNAVGVDYLGQVLVKNPNIPGVTHTLASVLIDRPGVVAVATVGFQGPTAQRKATVGYVVQSQYSSEPLSGSTTVGSTPTPTQNG